MGWLIKNPMTKFYIIAGTVLFMFAVIFAVLLTGPREGCALIGCVGGLEIELAGLPAKTPYEISIAFLSGEIQTLACGTENDQSEAFVKSCSPNGAFFSLPSDVEPPKEITVTVTVNGNQTSEVFRPDYQKLQPNGEDCPPVCYGAEILMNISQ